MGAQETMDRRIAELEEELKKARHAVRRVVEYMRLDPDSPGRVSWAPPWRDVVEAYKDLRATLR